ncbi:MAG: hypothetical protein IKC91_01390 [Clostridia bacterium]|nr:hypothetical protein [Clostridia bacterium]
MKRKIFATVLATVMTLCCFSSCALTNPDAGKDMAETVAVVDISQSDEFKANGEYAKYADFIQPVEVTKRELVAAFVGSGYNYVSQGMSYKDALAIVLESLTGFKIVVQYSMVYFLENDDAYTLDGYNTYAQSAPAGEDELTTALKYFLVNDEIGEVDGDPYTRYDMAVYTVNQSINSAIDSRESMFIYNKDASTGSGDEDRATPTGVNTQVEDFYDPDYAIYTGWNQATACGSYEAVKGSTITSRKQAYNSFINMLSSNYLLSEGEVNKVNTDGIASTEYYKVELLTQLQQQLSDKLQAALEEKALSTITADYLTSRYEEMLLDQQTKFDQDESAFTAALDAVSDTSFVLYAPEGNAGDATKYGFVSNILIPFSTAQEAALNGYKTNLENGDITEEEYYALRADLLNGVKATDQRETWFNGAKDYSYKAEGTAGTDYYGNSDYLFFEDSMTKADQYEEIQKYYGKYAYNGTVKYNANKGAYTLDANKLSITEFLTEMQNYMNWALGKEGYQNTAAAKTGTVSLNGKDLTATNGKVNEYGQNLYDDKGDIDYSSFVYYVGQVGNLTFDHKNALVNDNASYTAFSAFNDLLFAYSTDPGSLNTYFGYSLTRYKSDFVGEFEYASKLAVAQGVGTYTVCPSDYGWHIIYCTYTFDAGEVYEGVDFASYLANKDTLPENSFEYYFYEAIKDTLVSGYQTEITNKSVNRYNNSACVKVYPERYSDYTALDKNR